MDLHQWMRKTTSMLSSAFSHVMFEKAERNTSLGGWAMGKRMMKKLTRMTLRNLLRKELSQSSLSECIVAQRGQGKRERHRLLEEALGMYATCYRRGRQMHNREETTLAPQLIRD